MSPASLFYSSLFALTLLPTYISPSGINVYVDPPACSADQTAIRLHVTHIKKIKGSVVVDVHNDIVDDFLDGKKVLLRVRQSVDDNEMDICVPVPEPGNYALAIYHDKDNDKKFDKNILGIPSERFGLSRNPKYSRKKPKLIRSIFAVGPDGTDQSIRLVSASKV